MERCSREGPVGQSFSVCDSQSSDQRLMEFPDPTIHPKCLVMRYLLIKIPRQPWEAEDGAVVVRQDPLGQYFSKRQRANTEFGYLINLQLTLARRASLNEVKSPTRIL